MTVLCLNVCSISVPNIMNLRICFKKLHLVKVGTFAWYSQNSHYFRCLKNSAGAFTTPPESPTITYKTNIEDQPRHEFWPWM